VVVCCTGAVRPVVSLADVHRGLAHGQEPKQLVICDLGMPRDVDAAVAGLARRLRHRHGPDPA